MNLHEYQGKEILNSFGVRIQRGIVASTPAEAVEAAKKLTEETGTGWHVIKAQVHAGGRGKGGGVKLAKNLDQVKSIADDILGMMLITPQTSAEGKLVNQVLICEDVYYPGDEEPDEYYMSVLLNRATGKNMIMYSTEGGMARHATMLTPKRFHRLYQGIRALLRRKRATGMALEIIIGHCTFCSLIDRRLLSFFPPNTSSSVSSIKQTPVFGNLFGRSLTFSRT